MNKRRAFWIGTPTVALTVLFGGSRAARALDMQMYAITDWISECSGSDRTGWDDQVRSWYDAAALFGHNRQRSFVNGNFNRNLFCDPDTGLASCDDGAWGDSGDAVMVGLHGSDSGNHWAGSPAPQGGAAVKCSSTPPRAAAASCSPVTWTSSSSTSRRASAWTTTTSTTPGACSRTRWTRRRTAAACIRPTASTG